MLIFYLIFLNQFYLIKIPLKSHFFWRGGGHTQPQFFLPAQRLHVEMSKHHDLQNKYLRYKLQSTKVIAGPKIFFSKTFKFKIKESNPKLRSFSVCSCCRHAIKDKPPFESRHNFKNKSPFTIFEKIFLVLKF